MNWLPIKEVARRSGKAERTLRLYASQGRIKAKKAGREWLLEVASLNKMKINLAEATAKSTAMPKNTTANAAKSSATAKTSGKKTESPLEIEENLTADGKISARMSGNAVNSTATARSEKKYKLLGDLGVYRDLVEIWNAHLFENMDDVASWLKYSAEQLAIGFYEFHAERKIHYFRNAREGIVKAIVGISLCRNHEFEFLMHKLENEIVPGLIGLIKRYEKMKR